MPTARVSKPTADVAEIRRALPVLFLANDVVELRAIPSRQNTISGYYNDFDKLAQDAAKLNRTCGGVYVVLNQIDPALLARRVNRFDDHAATTTNDDHIIRRRWFPVDLDAKRPSGISASDVEHEAALECGQKVRAFLVDDLAWPQPVFADSGNGCHLLARVDLPNDDASLALIQAGLQALDAKFSDPSVKIDTGNYNAARIWKLYGSVAGKGDSTADRPHRLSRLIDVPEPIEVVPVEKLQALAALAPKLQPAHPRSERRRGSPDGTPPRLV